jgi:hypothetical protein
MINPSHLAISGSRSGGFFVVQIIIVIMTIGIGFALITNVVPHSIAWIILAVLFALQIFHELKCDERGFLLSPVFLLAVVTLIIFSILPNFVLNTFGMFNQLELVGDSLLGRSARPDQSARPDSLDYLGSRGESIILLFCASGLVIHCFVITLMGKDKSESRAAYKGTDRRPLFLYGVSTLFCLIFLIQTQFPVFAPSVTATLQTIFGPVQSFLLIFLLHSAAVHRHLRVVAVMLLIVAVTGVMVLASSGKIPAFMVLSAFIYYIAIQRFPFLRILKVTVLCSVILILFIQAAQVVRLPHASIVKPDKQLVKPDKQLDFRSGKYCLRSYSPWCVLQNSGEVLAAKLVWRQMETGFCFDNAVEKHGDQKLDIFRQTFWLEVLVPRIIWRDKPNFSLGGKYKSDYCKIKGQSAHSSSITLLGQPVTHGGMAGLIMHGALLLLLLGAITGFSCNTPGLCRIAVFALLPWWIDFDQDFALFIGNIVKFGLFMVPFIIFTSPFIGRRLGKTFLFPG